MAIWARIKAELFVLRHFFRGYQVVTSRHGRNYTWIAVVADDIQVPFNGVRIVKEFYRRDYL